MSIVAEKDAAGTDGAGDASNTAVKTHRKRRVGMVVSDKMEKTVVVEISTKVRHPLYGKYVKRRVRYKAHDEENSFGIGDTVEIEETRPLSRHKRWQVIRLVEKAR